MQLNKQIIGLALAMSLTTTPGFAQDGDDPPTHRIGRSVDRIMLHLDTDEDGRIDFGEFVDAALIRTENRFMARDADGDGLITEADFGDRPEPPEDIDRDAIRECVAEALGADAPEPPEPGERFAEGDLNGDGAIELGEALLGAEERAASRFSVLDADADGTLDIEELRAGVVRAVRLRQIRHDCREAQQDVADILG